MKKLGSLNESAPSHTEAEKQLVLIVADDLTGALDSAVPFLSPGNVNVFAVDTISPLETNPSTSQSFHSNNTPFQTVVSTWTDSRSLSPVSTKVAATKATMYFGEADLLFVKVDSTLRGNPADHMDGALEAWRVGVPRAFAVICPAHPEMGRTVVNGQVLDQLTSITESAASMDPVSSASSSLLSEIFAPCKNLEIRDISRLLAQHDNAAGENRPANVYIDATSTDDLEKIAAAIIALGNIAVAVGSAGLANAIAELRPRVGVTGETKLPDPPREVQGSVIPGRTLVLITSLHPIARLQLAALETSVLNAKFQPDDVCGDPSRVVVVATPDRSDPSLRFTQFVTSNAAKSAASSAVARLLAESFDSIVVIGGDGASALLREIGATAIQLTSQLLPGVPLGIIHGGLAHGMTIATRSGGFGDETNVIEILVELNKRIREEE